MTNLTNITKRACCLGLAAALVAAAPLESAFAQIKFEGRLTDEAGTPLPDADLDFFDSQTGLKVDPSAPGWEGQEDKTDAFGYFEMEIEPDMYDVRFEPPVPRTDLAPVFRRDLILAADTRLDVVLPSGARISGRVVDPSGRPVADVDLDLRDPETGRKLATVRDDTDADGVYGLTVIRGVWDVVFKPPIGSGAGPLLVDGVELERSGRLDVTLPRGFRVGGRVESTMGTGIFYADLDAEDVRTRRRIPTSDDETDRNGNFLVNLPEGTVHLFVTPPPGLPMAPAARYHVEIASDRQLDPFTLVPGVVVTGTARDPGGTPLPDADLDLFVAGTCDPYPALDARTDENGLFSIRVEPGTYDVVVHPSSGSSLPTYRFPAVDMTIDGTRELTVPDVEPEMVDVVSRVTGSDGEGLEGVVVRAEPLGRGTAWTETTGADGTFSRRVALGTYRVEFEPPAETELQIGRLEAVEIPCGFPERLALRARLQLGPAPAVAAELSNYPNPWRATTRISLVLNQPESAAKLEIFDIAGRRVRTLFEGPLPAGTSEIDWDGSSAGGARVASGLYFLRFQCPTSQAFAKITRLTP